MNDSRNEVSAANDLRRKLTIAGGVAALVAFAWLGARMGSARARYSVTGKVDPATGYRIGYTVSTRFNKKVDSAPMAQADHELESWVYDSSRQPTRSVSIRAQGRTVSQTGKAASDQSIRQATIEGASPRGTTVDKNGYVDLAGIAEIGQTVFKEHLLVSGCPATWTAVDIHMGQGANSVLHLFCLLVRPKNQPITYGFVGAAGTITRATELQDEMTNIRNSIKITKK